MLLYFISRAIAVQIQCNIRYIFTKAVSDGIDERIIFGHILTGETSLFLAGLGLSNESWMP